jgi:hypothetical protein
MKKIVLFILIVVIFLSLGVKAEERIVPIYIQNFQIDQNLNSRETLYPIYRSIDFNTPAKSSIQKLLNIKLTEKEKEVGFETEFEKDHGVIIESVNLKKGVLSIEFKDLKHFTTGGSLRVKMLKAQIEKTLLQFSSITEVNILPEYYFQP